MTWYAVRMDGADYIVCGPESEVRSVLLPRLYDLCRSTRAFDCNWSRFRWARVSVGGEAWYVMAPAYALVHSQMLERFHGCEVLESGWKGMLLGRHDADFHVCDGGNG